MADLSRVLGTRVVVEQDLIANRSIGNTVPCQDRVIVAEAINGRAIRKVRSGLIDFAYDLGLARVAQGFPKLSLDFSAYREGKTREFARCLGA